MSELVEPCSVAAATDVTQFIEIVPLTGDDDGPCVTECDDEDWFSDIKQEILHEELKPDPDDTCAADCDLSDEVQQEILDQVKQEPDSPSAADCDNGDWSADWSSEIKQEILQEINLQEADDIPVCYIVGVLKG